MNPPSGIVAACVRLGSYIHRTYVEHPGTSQSTSQYTYDSHILLMHANHFSLGSIAQENMFTLFEPGAYLIATCLPSLPSIFNQLRTTLSKSFTSMIRNLSGEDSHKNKSPGGSDFNEGLGNPRIDVRRTNADNLSTLAREENAIELTTIVSD